MRSHHWGLSILDSRQMGELAVILNCPEDQADVIKLTLSIDSTNYAVDRSSKL